LRKPIFISLFILLIGFVNSALQAQSEWKILAKGDDSDIDGLVTVSPQKRFSIRSGTYILSSGDGEFVELTTGFEGSLDDVKQSYVRSAYLNTWLESFLNPYAGKTRGMAHYQKADSMLQILEPEQYMELPLASSSYVFQKELPIIWSAGSKLDAWELSFKNHFDEVVESKRLDEFTYTLKLEAEPIVLYVKNLNSGIGSGNFVFIPLDNQKRIDLTSQIEKDLGFVKAQSVLEILALSAYFEQKGFYTDALGLLVGLHIQYPQWTFSEQLIRNICFRHLFVSPF
jgi:hypothetical protein